MPMEQFFKWILENLTFFEKLLENNWIYSWKNSWNVTFYGKFFLVKFIEIQIRIWSLTIFVQKLMPMQWFSEMNYEKSAIFWKLLQNQWFICGKIPKMRHFYGKIFLVKYIKIRIRTWNLIVFRHKLMALPIYLVVNGRKKGNAKLF